MAGPQVVPQPGLPPAVTIYEVGPRDGLQNEPTTVSVAVKAEFLARLADAGLTVLEAIGFVHPRWVPQLADAEQLIDLIQPVAGVRYPVLVPNESGLNRALDKGVRDIAIFGSATETFARRNLNRGLDESIAMFSRWWPGPGPRAWACGPTCRCASAIRGKARCRSSRSWGWAGAAGVGLRPAQPGRHDRRGHARPRHRAAGRLCRGRRRPRSVRRFDTYGQALAATKAPSSAVTCPAVPTPMVSRRG